MIMDFIKETISQDEEIVDNNSNPSNYPTLPVPPPHYRRKRGGRALRRRRKKAVEIQQEAEQALLRFQERGGKGHSLSDTNSPSVAASFDPSTGASESASAPIIAGHNNISSSVIVPDDRHQVWPAVLTRRSRLNKRWQAEDEVALVSQLGYLPGNVLQVTCYEADVPCLKGLLEGASGSLSKDHKSINSITSSSSSSSNVANLQAYPVAIQLYPIALRSDTTSKDTKGQGDNTNGGGGNNNNNNNNNNKTRSKRRRRQPSNSSTKGSLSVPMASEAAAEEESGMENVQQQQQQQQQQNQQQQQMVIEPFPTIYWLTHPILRVLISQLEVKGLGVEFERRLTQDPVAMASMQRAHQSYGQERQRLLLPEDVELIRARKWESAFSEERGVAGIRNFHSVKCLHAHAAHFLSASSSSSSLSDDNDNNNQNGGNYNVVGKWVMEEVEKLIQERKK